MRHRNRDKKANISFNSMLTGNFISIQLESSDDYRHVIETAHSNYQLPEDRTGRFLSEEDIKAELIQTGIPVLKVHRISKGGRPIPLVVVYLKDTPAKEKIFSVTHLGFMMVSVEQKRKSKFRPQCHIFMAFGHTINYCRAECVSPH